MRSAKSRKKQSSSDSSPSTTDIELGKTLGLSKSECERYKKLDELIQIALTPKLKQRKDLNDFVILHLGEKISPNQQFRALIKLLLPTEHALRYALQKVNHIEQEINQILALNNSADLFDDNTTKKHRIELLLEVALDYKKSLEKDLNNPHKHDQIQQKLSHITLIITEFEEQLKKTEFIIHNKTLLTLSDPDIQYFLSKLNAIGVKDSSEPTNGPKPAGLFKFHLISAFFKSAAADTDKHKDHNDDTSNKP